MKIEKINDNQIKCTLNRSDLASRQIKLSELAYGTEKAKSLFQDMMDQANLEFGFDAADFPLMIEAIPVSMDCIVLMITKVENPDEVDSRFASLTNVKDFYSGDDEDSSEDNEDRFEQPLSNLTNILPEFSELAKKALNSKPVSDFLFSFKDLENIIGFAHQVVNVYSGQSILYKSPENGLYYLLLQKGSESSAEFARICNIATEYGTREYANYARIAYLNEHFTRLIAEDAIKNLAFI